MIALSLRLLRAGGRSAWAAAGLVATGVAVATALLAFALGTLHGLDAREQRTGWRTPAAAPPGTAPVARLLVRTDHVADRAIQQIDIVDPRPDAAGPPGLPRMPRPGELWVSSALAELLRRTPADALAARYPVTVPTGVIGDAGLLGPDELVAVIGRPAGDPVLTAPVRSEVVAVAGFDRPGEGFGLAEAYRQLTYVALALLGFPVASLLGASARLSAARRTERLATLRLLGASRRQVTVAAVTEVTAVAAGAAVLGIAAEWLLAPVIARISLAGSTWFSADVRPAPLAALAALACVTLLAAGSAVGGLRRVVITPLGVVRRDRPQGARLVRLIGLAAGVAVFVLASQAIGAAPSNLVGLVFGIGVLALFGASSLIGPLVVRLLGGVLARRARSAPALLAGRRLLDDPKAAFRPLAGATLAVFVGAFLAPLTAMLPGGSGEDPDTLWVRVPAERGAAVTAAAAQRLDALGIAAQVGPPGTGLREGTVAVPVRPADAADRDRARTALGVLVPGVLVRTDEEAVTEETVLLGDVRRGTLVVLVGTLVIAATATGTAAAARVLDHRRPLRMLALAGTPLRVLDRARRAETVLPMLVNAGIALALGLLCASPFAGPTTGSAPSGLVLFGGVLLGGFALVLAASAASRPLLRSVTTHTVQEDV
ncbi:FtsX-like permease family protein [Pseudonocardia hispaniensis]|uniref:FtsX-like permease family protein n=1 Tax=Pseudonocardia hispaniensis TaxID=904933 RepID=A0ABW1J499_9PSEU